jgi:hypothetical protein
MKAIPLRSSGGRFGGALGAVLTGLVFGCESTPATGESGGGCRFGVPACNEGLVCFQGTCTPTDEAPREYPTEEDFSAEVQITKTTLEADGKDTVTFAFDLVDRRTGKPTTLPGLLIRTEPPRAGVVSPQKLPLEEGHGAVRVRACDPRYQRCPAHFTIVGATPEYPTEAVIRSPVITYTGLPEPETDGGSPETPVVDAGVVSGDAAVTPVEVPTKAQMDEALATLRTGTTDCDRAVEGYAEGPERELARTVCRTCGQVWQGGGAALVTTVIEKDAAAGTATPVAVRTATLRNVETSANVSETYPRVLSAEVRAGGGAPNALTFRIPYRYDRYVGTSGCGGANLEITGLDDWFDLRCETLVVPFCGVFTSSHDAREDLLLWNLDIEAMTCLDADGALVGGGPADPAPRLFLCVNTVAP